MKFPKIEECYKGDICTIEICIERSSAKDSVWVTMWKNEHERFQVSLIDDNKQGRDKYQAIQGFIADEKKARSEYEKACKERSLLPYPEDC